MGGFGGGPGGFNGFGGGSGGSGGGLLSKLFGGGQNGGGAGAGFPFGGSSGFGGAPGGFNGFGGNGGFPDPGGGLFSQGGSGGSGGLLGGIQNIQKVLKAAQNITPMVQQFGPLIKNLPSMMKMFSEFQSDDGDQSEVNSETNNDEAPRDTDESIPIEEDLPDDENRDLSEEPADDGDTQPSEKAKAQAQVKEVKKPVRRASSRRRNQATKRSTPTLYV
jgi:hypothetical protein